MREPVIFMKNRILSALESAGRNKRQLKRKLDNLEAELKKETGEKKVKWTEEYYLYLLETYSLAMVPAIEEAVALEEYEWAGVLTDRKHVISQCIESMEEIA